jgi:nucleoside 2-deoxyribosyltransferase
MKAYITCPVSHSQKRLGLLPIIKEVVESRGIETFVFQAGGSPKEIFERDLTQLKSSDILIAEVSERSHGVGVEIGLSYILGLKRILLIENGNEVTKLVQGIPDTVILKYTNEDDLKGKLDNYLQNLLEKQSVGIY